MTEDQSNFTTLANAMLDRVAEAVDDALGDVIDVELQGGILTMTIDGGGQYVLNKHGPNRELWLSSPVSGAWHFRPNDGSWMSTRPPVMALADVLSDELKGKFGIALAFDPRPPQP